MNFFILSQVFLVCLLFLFCLFVFISSVLTNDPQGDDFPWRPKTFWDILDSDGGELRSKKGTIKANSLRGSGRVRKKYIIGFMFLECLYLHW